MMGTQKRSRKLSASNGVACAQKYCAKRRAPATRVPEVTPVWMEQLSVEKDGHLAWPHVLTHNTIRWMW